MKGITRHLWAILFFVIASLVMTYPLVFKMTDHLRSTGDPFFITWNVAWNAHALREDPLNYFNGNIYYPQKNAVALSDSLASEMVVAFPIMLLTNNPVLAGNFLLLLSFILSGIFTYTFTYSLTRSRWAGVIAGSIYAFSAFRMAHSIHMNNLQTQWIPLAMYFFHRFYETTSRKHLVYFTIIFFVNMFSRWDYPFYLSIFILGYCGARVIMEPEKKLRDKLRPYLSRLRRLIIAVGVGLVVTAPLTVPTIQVYLDEPNHIRTFGDVQSNSARLEQYFTVVEAPANWLYQRLPIIRTRGYIEHSLFFGFGALLLSVLAVWKIWKERNIKIYSFLALWSFVFSLGPFPVVRNLLIPIPLPYAFVFFLFPPFRSIRVPTRFSVFVMLALAVLAAYAIRWFAERFAKRRYLTWGIQLGVLAFILLESLAIPWPFIPVRKPDDFPLVYHWLKEQAPGSPVLELPLSQEINAEKVHGALRGRSVPEGELLSHDWPVVFIESVRMYYSTLHWQPLVNGYSSYFPNTYREVLQKFGDFPTEEGIAFGRQLGIRYYVVHEKEFINWPDVEQRLQNTPSLALVGAFGDDRVYEYVESSSP